MTEYPEWFEILIVKFCLIYPVMMNEKAHAAMWEAKKQLWFNALSRFKLEAINDAMDAAFAGRLDYPDLPKFCQICDEFYRTTKYDEKKEFTQVEQIKKTPEEEAESRKRISEEIKKCLAILGINKTAK